MYKSEQLARSIRALIENGSWQAHSKLPSLREQVQRSGFSLMTVLNAYQELEAQGLVYSKEKSGYFVAGNLATQALAHHPETKLNAHIEINSQVFNYLKATQDEEIVPLGSAFPCSDLLYNAKLMQIIAQHAKRKRSYLNSDSMPPGNLELRKIIASRYSLQGIPTDANDIVITSGALEALNLSLQALTQAGDYILLQQNIFYGAWQAAERLGLKVITIPEHPQHGFDLVSFEAALNKYPIKVCWLMLNSHNPIGFTVSNEIKFQIAKLLHEHQVYLIEDDVYQELYYGAQKPLPMKYFDQHNYVLHCSSFSKTIGMGTRIGWVHVGKFSNAIQHLQMMSTLSASTLVQHALVDFLPSHHYEKHLRQLRLQLEHNKQVFYQFLKTHLSTQCEIYYYSSGYFLWVKFPEHVDSMSLYRQLLEYKIAIAPSSLFRLNTLTQNFIRINCSFNLNDRIQQALEQLISCIQQAINHRSDSR